MRDLVIVGGGPIGLATAIAARHAGLDALVVDRRRPPIDKACGEGLMPAGVAALAALGVDASLLGRPFAGLRLIADGGSRAVEVEARFCDGPGYGVRRTVLHGALVAAALRAGVELHWGTLAVGLTARGIQTRSGELAARYVVGADGLHSAVRRWAGLERSLVRRPRWGVRRHYACRPWTDRVEVYWSAVGEAYVTPIADDEIGVALLTNVDSGDVTQRLAEFPRLRESLGGASVSTPDRGAGPFQQRVRAVTHANVALVGDASGDLDPITGEGLSVGLRQAQALAAAIAAGDLAAYAGAHRRIGRRCALLGRATLSLSARPRIQRVTFAALARAPWLLPRLLAWADGPPRRAYLAPHDAPPGRPASRHLGEPRAHER